MYCRHCGHQVPEDAKFCPSCGANQEGPGHHARGIATPWIILALILLPPLGFILMFTSSRWSDRTKWIVGGFFFPPLWVRFLWQQPWARVAKFALLAAFLAVYFVLVWGFTRSSAAVWIMVLTIIALFFILRAKGSQPKRDAGAEQASLRGPVRAKLASCHDLIAQIEEHTVFDFVPMNSPERRQYVQALETRSEAMNLYEHASSTAELAAANTRATAALHELQAAQDALWTTSIEGDTRPQS